MGDQEQRYCGAVNSSFSLSMAQHSVLVDLVNYPTKLLVEYKLNEASQPMGFSLNLTQESGLVLKFMDNGDIMQSVHKASPQMKRVFTDIVSPYDV